MPLKLITILYRTENFPQFDHQPTTLDILNGKYESMMEETVEESTPSDAYADAGGGTCPECGSSDLDAENSVETDSGCAWQQIRCLGCHARWCDDYKLVGFTDLETAP